MASSILLKLISGFLPKLPRKLFRYEIAVPLLTLGFAPLYKTIWDLFTKKSQTYRYGIACSPHVTQYDYRKDGKKFYINPERLLETVNGFRFRRFFENFWQIFT